VGLGGGGRRKRQAVRAVRRGRRHPLDTANKYTNGTAESILGDLLTTDRDHFVVGTKYSLNVRDGDLNAGGNHRKSLVGAPPTFRTADPLGSSAGKDQ
jgi:aryl-alcohol dehydrogenase-like predicted oxidoreductase